MYRRILIGFDGSTSALQALRVALGMAEEASGEASVLIVVAASHGETEQDRVASFTADASPLEAIAQQELRGVARKPLTTSVHSVVGEHPAEALAAYANRHGYDLIVVGRHGLGRATHGGLGRTARGLAESAGCPLLLVGNGGSEDN